MQFALSGQSFNWAPKSQRCGCPENLASAAVSNWSNMAHWVPQSFHGSLFHTKHVKKEALQEQICQQKHHASAAAMRLWLWNLYSWAVVRCCTSYTPHRLCPSLFLHSFSPPPAKIQTPITRGQLWPTLRKEVPKEVQRDWKKMKKVKNMKEHIAK